MICLNFVVAILDFGSLSWKMNISMICMGSIGYLVLKNMIVDTKIERIGPLCLKLWLTLISWRPSWIIDFWTGTDGLPLYLLVQTTPVKKDRQKWAYM